MTAFVVICALLTATALVFILPPLQRSGAFSGGSPTEAEANVAVYQRQFDEMDSGTGERVMADETSRVAHEELERRLIVDLREAPAAGEEAPGTSSRLLLYGLMVGIPLAAAMLYLALGTPSSLQAR